MTGHGTDTPPTSTPEPWRAPAWLFLVLAPVALASALVYRGRIDWVYCLAASEGSAPRYPAPGLFSAEVLAALVPSSWSLTLIVVLAFAGPTFVALAMRRPGLGLAAWALVLAALVFLFADPTAMHGCDRNGVTREAALLVLPVLGWVATLAAAWLAGRRNRRPGI